MIVKAHEVNSGAFFHCRHVLPHTLSHALHARHWLERLATLVAVWESRSLSVPE